MGLLGWRRLDPPLPAHPWWGFDSFSLKNQEDSKTVFMVQKPRVVWQAAWGHTASETDPALTPSRDHSIDSPTHKSYRGTLFLPWRSSVDPSLGSGIRDPVGNSLVRATSRLVR